MGLNNMDLNNMGLITKKRPPNAVSVFAINTSIRIVQQLDIEITCDIAVEYIVYFAFLRLNKKLNIL